MRFKGLIDPLKGYGKFDGIVHGIKDNKFPISISGIVDSAKSFFIKGIYESTDKSIYIIANNEIEARNLVSDLSLYLNDVYYFPPKDIVFYNVYKISGDLKWERLKVIKELLNNKKKIIVTTIQVLGGKYIPKDMFSKYSFKLKVDSTIHINDLSFNLIKCGYERVDVVESKGQFSIRGGIIDIFPPIAILPYRIELFGDEIDSIRTFNVESQRSIEKVKSIDIFPAKEVILEKENLDRGYENILIDLEKALNRLDDNNQKEKLDRLTRNNLEMLKETFSFETIDNYIPYFYDKLEDFFAYIDDGLLIVDDIRKGMASLNVVYDKFREDYTTFLERGDVLSRQSELLVEESILDLKLKSSRLLILEGLISDENFKNSYISEDIKTIPSAGYNGSFELLVSDIKKKKEEGYKVIILSSTRSKGERLEKSLRNEDVESVYKDIIEEIKDGQIIITFGNLEKGFEVPELKIAVISDKALFGENKRKAKVKVNKKGVGKINSATDLKLGDYVVHVNHGVGVFKGIKQIQVGDITRDFLDIAYDNEDKLYVPVEQMDLIQKYIGNEGKSPRINKLGGSEWTKAKIKAKKSINEIAKDLVELYATRSAIKGFKYSEDTAWQTQFEDDFPFDETPDQITSIQEIKSDMESDKPMDRLLCGDVGYGKTEVALRAAFKAVMDGKQVAILVPTTILAEQHYNTMKKRFEPYSVNVDMISRFRSSAQIKSTLNETSEGRVDVLVGTHRLIQKDVNFKDLGLLIVDEEQRFGVTHKEKIKNLKKNIDVLTLSATPIPRTLHMSLSGVRDISVIETPPQERHPVLTYVVEYNDQLIRDSIVKEIARDGQVFFIYNSIEHIDKMAEYLRELVPEAKIATAHGRMTEKELEEVMKGFLNNDYNMLICTTIVETGMDIKNANTMIIYDADKMGLSQLYQLRGRVGRSDRLAYAYLTYRPDKILSEVSEKRLKAIKEFTELGSGFKIAMKDLEIRGAGNLMGSSQHGHMASIGYDLYCKMLEDTVKLIKGEIDKEPIETTVEFKIDAYIPSNYIEDEPQKIEVYKKIASINSIDDYLDVKEELEDRFSDIPSSVYNLMDIAYIRSVAKSKGIVEIKERGQEVQFTFDNKKDISDKLISLASEKLRNTISFKEVKDKPVVIYKFSINDDDKISIIKNFVNSI